MPGHLDGVSLSDQLGDGSGNSGKDAVYARVGDAEIVLTSRYAYTEWQDNEGQDYARMLFDHKKDPEESNNLVGNPDYQTTIDSLSVLLNMHLATRK
jgi:hypothetical protein